MAGLARVSAAFDEAFSKLPTGLESVEHALTAVHSDLLEQEKSPITRAEVQRCYFERLVFARARLSPTTESWLQMLQCDATGTLGVVRAFALVESIQQTTTDEAAGSACIEILLSLSEELRELRDRVSWALGRLESFSA